MIRAFIAAFILICASQNALANAPDVVLPTLNDELIQKQVEDFAQYPRAKPQHRDIDTKDILKKELSQKAQELDYLNFLDKAVEVCNAAIKTSSDPSLRLNRGLRLGRMGKWTAAAEDLKVGSGSRVEEVAEFCLANGHPEVARLFENQLRTMYDKSSALRTVSKICLNTGRANEGRSFCEQAVYLDWVRGDDMTESLKYYEAVYCRCNPRNQKKATSGVTSFWRTVDDLIERQIINSPNELKSLIPEPVTEYGTQGSGRTKSVFCYLADDLKAPIRTASFIGGDDAKPHGFCLIPNLLSCCVIPDDVDQFLKKHGFLSERTETTKSNPYSPQEFSIISKTPWGKLTFWFHNSGWQPLKRVDVYFNKSGSNLVPLYSIPEKTTQSWSEELATSKTLLQQKKYLQSRTHLLKAFALWDNRSDLGGLPFTSEKRLEYETLKQQFILFYKQWGRSEVVKYLEATSHWQLAGEVYALIDEKTYDLPKFYDYKNIKWKLTISGQRGTDTIILRVPSCVPRKVSAGSPLFSELLQKSEDGPSHEQRTISPIPAIFLDDQDFAAAPVSKPESTSAPDSTSRPAPVFSPAFTRDK